MTHKAAMEGANGLINYSRGLTTVNGTNLLLAKQVVTNAGNTVKVSATCSPLARMQPRGDVRACVVVKQGLSTYLRITTDEPIGVTVNLTAPAVGKYSAYKQVQVYFVR